MAKCSSHGLRRIPKRLFGDRRCPAGDHPARMVRSGGDNARPRASDATPWTAGRVSASVDCCAAPSQPHPSAFRPSHPKEARSRTTAVGAMQTRPVPCMGTQTRRARAGSGRRPPAVMPRPRVGGAGRERWRPRRRARGGRRPASPPSRRRRGSARCRGPAAAERRRDLERLQHADLAGRRRRRRRRPACRRCGRAGRSSARRRAAITASRRGPMPPASQISRITASGAGPRIARSSGTVGARRLRAPRRRSASASPSR